MKVEIKNRWSGEVMFSVELDTDQGFSINLGLSVKKAIEQGANLRDANLGGANLGGAYLRGAYLRGADLGGANLRDANLRDANLGGADLGGADLGGAYLRGANLRDANLGGANLGGAYLRGAYLRGAYLRGATGNNNEVKSLQTGKYPVTYTSTHMQIGCQRHPIEEWWSFDNRRIADMDGRPALEFWKVWKAILQAIIEASPAVPTGYVETAPQTGEAVQ